MPERISPRVGEPPNTPFAPPPKIRDVADAGMSVVAAWSANQYVLMDRQTQDVTLWRAHKAPNPYTTLQYGPKYLEFVQNLSGSGTGLDQAQPPVAAKAPAGELLDAFASPKASSGHLAKRYSGLDLPVQVLRSGAGYYLGTIDEDGPCSRESQEYFPNKESAEAALQTGRWTQRERP